MKNPINRCTILLVIFLLLGGVLFPLFAIDLNTLDFLPGWGTLNDTHVRVRTAPNLNGDTVGFLNLGDRVRILERSSEKMKIGNYLDYWYKIGKVIPVEAPVYGLEGGDFVRINAHELESLEIGWAYAVFIDSDDTNLDRTLIKAVTAGSENDVYQLLQAGANPSAENIERKIQLTFGDDVAGIFYETSPALGIALENDYTEIARLLLSKGADPNAGNSESSPLSLALMNNHIDLSTLLLAKGASPDSNALFEAVEKGYLGFVKTLESRGVDLQSAGQYIGSGEGSVFEPLILTAIRNDQCEIARYLVEKGAKKPDQYFFESYLFDIEGEDGSGTWFEIFGDRIENSLNVECYESIFSDYFGFSFDDVSPQWV